MTHHPYAFIPQLQGRSRQRHYHPQKPYFLSGLSRYKGFQSDAVRQLNTLLTSYWCTTLCSIVGCVQAGAKTYKKSFFIALLVYFNNFQWRRMKHLPNVGFYRFTSLIQLSAVSVSSDFVSNGLKGSLYWKVCLKLTRRCYKDVTYLEGNEVKTTLTPLAMLDLSFISLMLNGEPKFFRQF